MQRLMDLARAGRGVEHCIKYEIRNGKPDLMPLPKLFFDDARCGSGLIISSASVPMVPRQFHWREMLEWAGAAEEARLKMLVHHDDAAREYAYAPAACRTPRSARSPSHWWTKPQQGRGP